MSNWQKLENKRSDPKLKKLSHNCHGSRKIGKGVTRLEGLSETYMMMPGAGTQVWRLEIDHRVIGHQIIQNRKELRLEIIRN